MHVLFYYQNQLPDLSSWQISAVMLLGSLLNIVAVYLASKIGKNYAALKLFPVPRPADWSHLYAVLLWNTL